MKLKFILILTFSLNVIIQMSAQQEALYVTYPYNPQAINPAYAGSNGIASVSILVRKQSLVLQGAGTSQFLSYNTPLANGKASMGFQAFNTSFGQVGSGGAGVNLSAGFRHHFSDSISISVAGQGGFAQIPSFLGVSQFKPNAGVGLYFRTFRSNLGVSMPTITNSNFNNITGSGIFAKPMFISGGYFYPINNVLDIKIGALASIIKDQKTAIDLNTVIWYNKKIGIGIWRNDTGSEINTIKAFIISIEAQINQKFRIGLSMDTKARNPYSNTSPINPTTGRNTNLSLYNIMLKYDFDNLTGKINNFRFF